MQTSSRFWVLWAASFLLVTALAGAKQGVAQTPERKNLDASLALGDYVCDTGAVGRFQPRGVLTLKAGGTYDYTLGGGRYQYDAASRTLRFSSGYFFTTRGVGKFTPSKRVAQVDIDYVGPPSSYWSCGHNMP